MKNNYPNLYISEIFLDSLDKKLEEVRSHSLLDFNNSNKRKSLDRIIDLFFIGNIYSDIEEYKIEQFRKKSLNDYKFKDVLLKKIIEEDSNKRIFEKGLKRNDCKLSNFCFFIDKNHEDCENLSQTEGKIIIADVGHFESEQFTQELLLELITEKFRNFALRLTVQNTNPINYLI